MFVNYYSWSTIKGNRFLPGTNKAGLFSPPAFFGTSTTRILGWSVDSECCGACVSPWLDNSSTEWLFRGCLVFFFSVTTPLLDLPFVDTGRDFLTWSLSSWGLTSCCGECISSWSDKSSSEWLNPVSSFSLAGHHPCTSFPVVVHSPDAIVDLQIWKH